MSIFNASGDAVNIIYDQNGNQLSQAYDMNDNELIPTEPPNFVVMSYNVQIFTGLNANEQLQQNIISTYNADIIGLQEVGGSIPEIGQSLLSDYSYKELGVGTNKTALASTLPLNSVSNTVFTNQASETRGFQKAYINFNGKNICWINTHLETSDNESVKVAQAQEIFNAVQSETYFIITGDFNTVCKTVTDPEYTSIMAQFINAGYNSANCSLQHGFLDTWTSGYTASGTWYPCDQIITSGNISIQSVIVDTSKIDVAAVTHQSIDHLPIIAYLIV